MANKYWAAGVSGNWNDINSWSDLAIGTPAGAAVPETGDAVFFNAASGTVTATLDISPVVQSVTCTGFTGTLAFDAQTITVNSTGTVFTGVTTMTVTGTPLIILTETTPSATARTISPAAVTEANSISFRITGSTGNLSINTGAVRDLDFTDGVNPTGYGGQAQNMSVTVYGNFKASTNMTKAGGTSGYTLAATSGTKTVDTAGVTFDNPFVFGTATSTATFQLQSDLIASVIGGTNRTTTLTGGTLDMNGYSIYASLFASSGSVARTLDFKTGTIFVRGSGATVLNMGTSTNLTFLGTPQVEATYSGSTGTRSFAPPATGTNLESLAVNVRVSAGGDIISLGTTSSAYKNAEFTAGFTGTVSISNTISVYGDWTFSPNMVTPTTGSSNVNFFSTSATTRNITCNGKAFGTSSGATFNGIGGSWALQDAFTIGGGIVLTNGVLTTNGYAITAGSFASANTNARTLNLGASLVTLTSSGTTWNFATTTGLVFDAGTSSISFTNTNGNCAFAGGGLTYNNVTFGATYRNLGLSGNNTFNNLTLVSPGLGRRALSVTATRITILGTLSCSGAAANRRPRITGGALGVTFNVATVAPLSDVDFLGVTAAGASAPWSGTRIGNMGLNTNITFDAPKTVYWNQPAGGNWSDVAWATSSGGTVDINNHPLGQDTAVLDNTGVGASSTIVMDYGWVLGRLNAGALTNALTINWNVVAGVGVTSIGSMTLSSAITVTYTAGSFSIATLNSPATITTAGVSFPIPSTNFNAAGNTFVLADNFTVVGGTGLVAGTIDLNGKTWTGNTVDLSFTDNEVHAIAFNGGQINVAGNAATVWACEDLTNFSYTGTPTVNFTYTGSTGTRVINHGATAGGTEANAVDFNIVGGGDTVNFTAGATGSKCRNLTYQAAFTGTSEVMSGSYIYGNLLLSPSMVVSSGTSGPIFAATSGTKTITTSALTIDRPITFNGVGGTWAMQDALTLGSTRTLTMTNGTLQLKAATTNTAGGFTTLGENQKFLQSTVSGTQATLSVASGTISATHLSIKDIVATGGATFNAYTTNANADLGNNTGWDFSQASAKYIYTRRKLKRIIF